MGRLSDFQYRGWTTLIKESGHILAQRDKRKAHEPYATKWKEKNGVNRGMMTCKAAANRVFRDLCTSFASGSALSPPL